MRSRGATLLDGMTVHRHDIGTRMVPRGWSSHTGALAMRDEQRRQLLLIRADATSRLGPSTCGGRGRLVFSRVVDALDSSVGYSDGMISRARDRAGLGVREGCTRAREH